MNTECQQKHSASNFLKIMLSLRKAENKKRLGAGRKQVQLSHARENNLGRKNKYKLKLVTKTTDITKAKKQRKRYS